MIVVLSGGVGAGKLLEGLKVVTDPSELFIIVNTGDDREFFGLHVSPDVDIITYTLAGIVDQEHRWGIQGDTFTTLEWLRQYFGEEEVWFNLGDKDLATHIYRTEMLKQGTTLTEITETVCQHLDVLPKIVPMSNELVQTHIKTPEGLIHFEEFFVKNQCQDEVLGVEYRGIGKVKPSPGIIEAIRDADRVIICPSNPIASIGPILAIPEIRKVLKTYKFKGVAVSPIIAGKTIKGPADKLMEAVGYEATCVGVARYYQDFIDKIIIDEQDVAEQKRVEELGLQVTVTDTIMDSLGKKTELAKKCLSV